MAIDDSSFYIDEAAPVSTAAWNVFSSAVDFPRVATWETPMGTWASAGSTAGSWGTVVIDPSAWQQHRVSFSFEPMKAERPEWDD